MLNPLATLRTVIQACRARVTQTGARLSPRIPRTRWTWSWTDRPSWTSRAAWRTRSSTRATTPTTRITRTTSTSSSRVGVRVSPCTLARWAARVQAGASLRVQAESPMWAPAQWDLEVWALETRLSGPPPRITTLINPTPGCPPAWPGCTPSSIPTRPTTCPPWCLITKRCEVQSLWPKTAEIWI